MKWLSVPAVAVPGLLLAAAGLAHPAGLTPETARDWWQLHVWLIPVFPLLAVSLWVLLRGDDGPVAWLARIAGYGYACFYTALDVLAGIGAGLVVENDGRGSQNMLNLFAVGDRLGLVGSACFLAASALTALALARRHGARVLPGAVVLLVAGWFFLRSHIFAPVGVLSMVGVALGTALLAVPSALSRGGGARETTSEAAA